MSSARSERPRFVAERLATYLQAAHPAFFSRLQRAVLVQLCAAGMTQVVAEPGEVICKHGSAVSGVHVLLSGSASVWLPSGGELTRSNTLRSSLLAASGTPRSPSCGSYGPGSATSTPKPGGSGGGGSTSSSRAGATSSAANSPKPGAVPHWFPLQGGGSSQTAPPPPRIPSPRAHGNSPLGGASDVTATVTHFSFHDAAAGATASAKASPPPAPSSSSSSSAPADAAAARGLNPLSVSTTARDDSPNGGGGGELGLPSPSPRISFNLGRGLGGLKIPTNVGTGSAGADTSRAATPAGPVPPSPTLSPSPAAPGSARGRSGWGKAKGLQAALALSRSMSRMGGPRRAAAAAVQALAADGNYGEMRSADGEDAGELNVALADVLAGRPGLADSLGRLAAYLSAPGWWGELAVVAPGTKHAASVVAVSPCWVLELPVGVLSGANLPPLTAAVAEDGDGGGAAAAGPGQCLCLC